jgi:hypothetical protein
MSWVLRNSVTGRYIASAVWKRLHAKSMDTEFQKEAARFDKKPLPYGGFKPVRLVRRPGQWVLRHRTGLYVAGLAHVSTTYRQQDAARYGAKPSAVNNFRPVRLIPRTKWVIRKVYEKLHRFNNYSSAADWLESKGLNPNDYEIEVAK